MATVIWHKSTDEENNTVAMFAASKHGSGRVIGVPGSGVYLWEATDEYRGARRGECKLLDDAVLAVGQWLDAT